MDNDLSKRSRLSRWLEQLFQKIGGWSLLLGMFLLILGARLWFLHNFAVAVIYRDDWPIEGVLFKRYIDGMLSLRFLISPYYGHRILIPRLFFLSLFCANGRQWDPLLVMVAKAPFYALQIPLFIGLVGKLLDRVGMLILSCFAAFIGIIPFGWENALYACNIHFHLFVVLGVLVAWICWRYEALSWRWWIGALIALANMFVMMGGGVFTIAVALFLMVGQVMEPARRNARTSIGIVILLAIVGVNVIVTPLHPTKVASLPQFVKSLFALLSWPDPSHAGLFLLIQAPLMLLAFLLLGKRALLSDGRWYPVVIGAAFWIQSAATVHQRLAEMLDSRFCDSWVLLLIVNATCLCILAKMMSSRGIFIAIATCWTCVVLYGLLISAFFQLPQEIAKDRMDRLADGHVVRQYLYLRNKGNRDGKDAKRSFLIAGENRGVPIAGMLPNDAKGFLESCDADFSSVCGIFPPDVYNPNEPLVPVQEQLLINDKAKDQDPYGLIESVPFWRIAIEGPVYGPSDKSNNSPAGGLRMRFGVPYGVAEVNLLVAGNVDFIVNSFRLKPLSSPELWMPVSVKIKPSAATFDISASGRSLGSMAFSAPTISTRHVLGRCAQAVIGETASDGPVRVMWAGVSLMALAVIATMGRNRVEPGQCFLPSTLASNAEAITPPHPSI